MQKTTNQKHSTDYPLDIWEKLEIRVEENDEKGVYVSRVEDFTEEGIIIAKPEYSYGSKLLIATAMVYVCFMKSDAMYGFTAKMKPYSQNQPGQVLLYSIGTVKRMQRREFVRIAYTTSLKYTILNVQGEIQEYNWRTSMTDNLSAGGLLITVDDNVRKDDLMLLSISNHARLGVPRFIAAICRRLTGNKDNLKAGVEFIKAEKLNKFFSDEQIEKFPTQAKKFDSRIQNKLVRFVFEEQVRERNKGLL
jgi:c-di-GMP-binding flagellar brake protein YcgR